MKSVFIGCLSFLLASFSFSQEYPPPSCVHYINGNLNICPPDSVPGYSGGLLGYNVYMDNEFIENLPAGSPEDTVTMTFDPLPLPGYRTFCATANYLNWISDYACDTVFVNYGYELPFTEDWSSGSMETNGWTQEGNYWVINDETGNPPPSAEFHPETILTDYLVPLTSYSFVADTSHLENIIVEFDIKLESMNNTGDERLFLHYWKWESQTWHSINCGGFDNEDGSFDWKHIECSFTSPRGGPFLIRFAALGENSGDISGWYIDNINVYQDCGSVSDLTSTVNAEGDVELEWDLESGYFDCWWCWIALFNWSGDYGNSIGTGSQVVFDVAARWTPEMLTAYNGSNITAVRFWPAEAQAIYSIRIWEGDSANLVYEQTVPNPIISAWNEVCLDSIHAIDITQDLWIGYHVDATTGYPAGTDWGPAFEGFGNMMYFEGQWSTLLEINPELDYNWLIEAFPGPDYPLYSSNQIYKKVGDGEYDLIAQVPADEYYEYYIDEQVDLTQINCYKVTNFVYQFPDACESAHYGESCVLPVDIPEKNEEDGLNIYPNPATDELYIYSSLEILELSLIDITGREMYIETDLNRGLKINVSNLSEGIYLLKVLFKDKQVSRKVLIK